jgi:hypothetical protein
MRVRYHPFSSSDINKAELTHRPRYALFSTHSGQLSRLSSSLMSCHDPDLSY